MDNSERAEFWKTLCSLSGNDKRTDAEVLKKTIKLPQFLFRYRSVNINSLEALRTNKLYFSSANYYDDPFDTFLHINVESLRKEFLSAFQTEERTEAVVQGVKDLMKGFITDEQASLITSENLYNSIHNGLADNFLNSALSLRDDIKKDTWSVCFSEDGFNEVLWLKYADQHKGFVQMYDLTEDDNLFCGRYEKCNNCGIYIYGTPLYPIYYSDKPYDATNYAKFIMLRKICEIMKIPLDQKLLNGIDISLWEAEKVTLIKKECHMFDKEWRIITNCKMKPPVMMEWIPSGIILGLRMEKNEENLVISMAEKAGIKRIYKSFINHNNILDAKLI